MLKGPNGCGKTRFLEYMAWRCGRPLVTIACHEDLTASDLVGCYLLQGEDPVWMDGPLSLAVKHGAICYLDKVVEARKDITVAIHPLTDDRRILPQEKRGLVLEAHPNFLLVISSNQGYQTNIKDLKHSTRQRFIALEFDYPSADKECEIIMKEGRVNQDTAESLVRLGKMLRNLGQHGLEEAVSTRLLVYAAQLIHNGLSPRIASKAAFKCEKKCFMEINPDFISPCGLYRGVCAVFYATRDNNENFKKRLVDVYKGKIAGSEYLSSDEIQCEGCLSDNPFRFCKTCSIKDCTQSKGYSGCHECEDFPCKFIEDFPMPIGKKLILSAIPYWREHGSGGCQGSCHLGHIFSCLF